MIGYVDCFSGISGDMLLGALVDAGLPLDDLRAQLARLPLGGYRVEATPRTSHGVAGTRVQVVVDDSQQPERRLDEILQMLDRSEFDPDVRDRSGAIFRRLARAEAHVHGTSVDAVHFHEVGAVDSIVDVVGAVVGLRALGVERVYASGLPLPVGSIRTRHGLLPAPAPATVQLMAEVNAPTRQPPPGAVGELVTPTGAAILAELATFEQPPMRLHRIGYGFGTRELPWPNAVRLWLGAPAPRPAPTAAQASSEAQHAGLVEDEVVVIETNVDDASPEILGFAMERLLAAGALDVWFAPIQMKKNRPGTMLGVIAPPERARDLAAIVLSETTTLGVRMSRRDRLIAERRHRTVDTPLGPVRIKEKRLGDRIVSAPEYDDCVRLAREHGLPLAEVFDLTRDATRKKG